MPITFDANTDPYIKKIGGLGNAARETQRNFLQQQISDLLTEGMGEAKRLDTTVEGRGQRMEDIVAGALPAANAPTFTEQDYRTMVTDAAEPIGRDQNAMLRALRSQFGAAGQTGGGRVAAYAGNIALKSQAQLNDTRRALYLDYVRQRGLDAARNFQNTLTYANAVNREPSAVYANFISDATGVRLGQAGNLESRSAAKDAANASKQAGVMSLAGSLGGALIGAL